MQSESENSLKKIFRHIKNKVVHFISSPKNRRVENTEDKEKNENRKIRMEQDNPNEKHKKIYQPIRQWTDDYYSELEMSRVHYRNAFWVMIAFISVLLISLCVVLPLQHTELVVLHEGENGYNWFSTTAPKTIPPVSWAREASEIAHYIRVRESYDPLFYAHQAHEVQVMSSSEVEAEYEMAQSSEDKTAPINVLGAKGYRTVVVNTILPIHSGDPNSRSKNASVNLAEVSFVVSDHLFGENQTIDTSYTALVSWKYTGVPEDPELLLLNWDGFQITKYAVEPLDVGAMHA